MSEAALSKILETLRSRDTEFVFLVFTPEPGAPEDWRDKWIRGYFDKRGLPNIWTADVLAARVPQAGFRDLISSETKHPTPLYNEAVAEEIKEYVRRAAGTGTAK